MLRSLCRRPRRKSPGGPGLNPERFRIFAAACARRVWAHLPASVRLVLEHLERIPNAPDPDLFQQARQICANEMELLHQQYGVEVATMLGVRRGRDYRKITEITLKQWAVQAVGCVALPKPYEAAQQHFAAARAVGLATHLVQATGRVNGACLRPDSRLEQAEFKVQAALLREVFGNPYRKAAVDPAWRAWNGRAVVRVAEQAVETRDAVTGHLDPIQLAVLADALEEAGCTVPALLDHLRSPGPHVLGCSCVDLVLDKF